MIKIGAKSRRNGNHGMILSLDLSGLQTSDTLCKLLEIICASGFLLLDNGKISCRLSAEQRDKLSVLTSDYVDELSFLGLLRGEENAVTLARNGQNANNTGVADSSESARSGVISALWSAHRGLPIHANR